MFVFTNVYCGDAVFALIEILDQRLQIGYLHISDHEDIGDAIHLKQMDILHHESCPTTKVVAQGVVDPSPIPCIGEDQATPCINIAKVVNCDLIVAAV